MIWCTARWPTSGKDQERSSAGGVRARGLEYERLRRFRQRILPLVFFVIFLLLYMVFHSVTEAAVLIFPTIYALTGGLILQKLLGYNFSVAVRIGYIALFGIAVETGVVMVV
jgi:Cu(I)/Ag(I) efflux system membrane protein CusA/SilA